MVNVASIAGYTGAGSSIPYAVSKGAMITLTRSLAKALGAQDQSLRHRPGDRHHPLGGGAGGARRALRSRYASERAVTAEDCARVVVSFAVYGTFLTGEVTIVDGDKKMR